MLREESFQSWFWICYQSFVLVGIDDNKKMAISRIDDNNNVEDHYQAFSPSNITRPTKTSTSDPQPTCCDMLRSGRCLWRRWATWCDLESARKNRRLFVRDDLVRCLFIISSMCFEENTWNYSDVHLRYDCWWLQFCTRLIWSSDYGMFIGYY